MKFAQSNNAALVIPMFGDKRWNYIDLWLSTVSRQPMDVLFFTNYDIGDVPDNVKLIPVELDYIFDRAEECFQEKFNNRFAYKLCDLKSFYGDIFKEELQHYDYWGYGDCDVCYGRLPTFFESDLYCACGERSDMDLVKSETPLGRWFIPGHFVMMRNTDKSRGIMDHLPTGKRLMTDKVNRYIDEHLVPTVLRYIFPEEDRYMIRSNDLQYLRNTDIRLENGQLFFDSRPAHYIHFYTDKKRIKTPHWRDIPETFNLKEYIT